MSTTDTKKKCSNGINLNVKDTKKLSFALMLLTAHDLNLIVSKLSVLPQCGLNTRLGIYC